MQFTVSDFLNTHEHQVRLLAGQGGLARPVSEVGILDYELVPGLTSRYQRNNFYEGQLVLSTFLYARDSPYLITEAVRYLASVGASGLVIKNVFHLELPDAALRFANARNLPLMVVSDEGLFFDQVIIDVGLRVRELSDSSFAQRTIDELLRTEGDSTTVRTHALRLNPSFEEEHVALFAQASDEYAQDVVAAFGSRDVDDARVGVRSLLCPFDEGLLLVVSSDVLTDARVDEAADALRAETIALGMAGPVGVSLTHRSLDELGQAILEAIHAQRMAQRSGRDLVRYEALGVLRAVLPHATSDAMRRFAGGITGPIRDFDAENNAQVTRTLEAYLECGRSVGDAASRLGTHPNTVRYRLGQIAGICGLDWRVPEQMEQLSLACAIELAAQIQWS